MVAKPKGLTDKTTTLKDAVHEYVKDGINLAIGGFVNTLSNVLMAEAGLRYSTIYAGLKLVALILAATAGADRRYRVEQDVFAGFAAGLLHYLRGPDWGPIELLEARAPLRAV